MINDLKNGLCWITLVYSDHSRKAVYTTMNPDILKKENVVLRKDTVYDFNRKQYLSLDSVTDVELTIDKPVYSREVDNFVNHFI